MRPYLQHARRHLPGGSDPIPDLGQQVMPYAQLSLASWNWTSGATQRVDWTGAELAITDPSVFVDNLGTDPGAPILINEAGIYHAYGGIGPWNPSWGTNAVLVDLGPDLGSFGAGMGDPATSFPLSFPSVAGITGASPSLAIVSTAIIGDSEIDSVVQMNVLQNSGLTRNVTAAITIIRLTGNSAGI